MSVSFETDPEFRASAPRLLFEGSFELETNGYRNFDVSPDGRRFVMIQGDDEPALDRFVVILDWFEELERLVPTR